MADVVVRESQLVVHLSPLEKLAAFHGDVAVPLDFVRDAEVEPEPWQALRGVRAPGTGLPGVIAYGIRRFRGGTDFAAIVGRRPAVRIELDPASGFGRLLVTVSDPSTVAATVRRAAGH